MAEAIRKLVIVGGGTAGWLSAATCARLLGPQVAIEVVESDEIGTVGVGEATIPQIRLLLQVLGINETDFLRHTNGTIKLGIEFDGWAAPGQRYMHAFGTIGRGHGLLDFHPYWLRARQGGANDSLWSYCLNYQAATRNRFAPLAANAQQGLDGLVYAYHFDAGLVAGYLRRYAEGLGVVRTEGQVLAAALDSHSGFIHALRLAGGRQVAGDFFIDCSGFHGVLIEQALHSGYEDWSHWLPCDRAIAVPSAPVAPLLPYTRATARAAGWQWRIPLRNRTGNGHVYCSRYLDDDNAADILLRSLDGEPLAEPRQLRFTTGIRKQVWKRNCVALGLASGFMEPLESTSIHLVQSGIDRLLRLFPSSLDDSAGQRRAYNQQTRREYTRIRDFLVLHYYANQRDEPFWAERRALTLPDTLRDKIELFAGSGTLVRDADDLFTEVAWLQVLVGQGLLPRRYHPLADRLDAQQLAVFLTRQREAIAAAVSGLPDHQAFLDAALANPATPAA